jgi:hypothetical protein
MDVHAHETHLAASADSRPTLLPLGPINTAPSERITMRSAFVTDDVDSGWESVHFEPKLEKEKGKPNDNTVENDTKPTAFSLPPIVNPSTISNTDAKPAYVIENVPEARELRDLKVPNFDIPTRPKNWRPKPIFRPEIINSYRELFNVSGEDQFCYDKIVALAPFFRLVHIVQATYEKEDFYRWAWLLAQSEERWYEMPSAGSIAKMRTSGLKKRSPVARARPLTMAFPSIIAGDPLILDEYGEERVEFNGWGDCALLHPGDDADESDDEDNKSTNNGSNNSDKGDVAGEDSENGENESALGNSTFGNRSQKDCPKWGCRKCYHKGLELHKEVGWIYLSVVKTDKQTPDYDNDSAGTSLFMLRKNGSRDGMAAQAFHDAAAMGWSTVFCCAMRAEADLLEWDGKLNRVLNYVHKVLAKDDTGLRVFF